MQQVRGIPRFPTKNSNWWRTDSVCFLGANGFGAVRPGPLASPWPAWMCDKNPTAMQRSWTP